LPGGVLDGLAGCKRHAVMHYEQSRVIFRGALPDSYPERGGLIPSAMVRTIRPPGAQCSLYTALSACLNFPLETLKSKGHKHVVSKL
jgi:hypothetical protein